MKHLNPALTGLVGIYALISLFPGCSGSEDQQKNAATSIRPTLVEVQVVSLETHNDVRILNGDVLPWSTVPLVFKVGGRITRLDIEEGDRIQIDQFIGALDTRDYRLMRDLATAQIDALDPHLTRAMALKEHDVVPQAQLDELTGRMGVARVQKSQADAQLSYARLKSPVDGVLISKLATVGDMTDPKHPVGIVAEMDRVKVVLPLAQRDLPLFTQGAVVSLKLPGSPDTFQGTVHAIGYAANERTRTFPLTLEVPNPSLKLRAGMIVEAHVNVGVHQGIFVTLDTVTTDISGTTVAMVLDESSMTARSRRLTLGSVIGDKVQVTAGLFPGDKIIVCGIVGDQDPVQVVDPANDSPRGVAAQ